MKIASQANKTRKYPQQIVKLDRKKATTEKERGSNWGKETYTVENIATKFGQEYCETSQGKRAYLRFKLLEKKHLKYLKQLKNIFLRIFLVSWDDADDDEWIAGRCLE